MKITVENGMAKVFTPYNATFVAKIKNIGGRKWNADERCWSVPEAEIETVRQYMMDVYGETDIPDETERVTVKVTFLEDAEALCDSVNLFGKNVARATGRDSGAKVENDVTLIDGKIRSGGSARYWKTIVEKGTIVKVRNVPKSALGIATEYEVEVEEISTPGIDRAALIAEKEKLMARLAEIEKLLAQ